MSSSPTPHDVGARLALVERNTAELLTRDEIAASLASGRTIQHYIGFEISGLIHLGSGLVSMGKVRDFMEAGITCRVFLADWHTWINDKLDGNLDTIRRFATSYFAQGMKASLLAAGGDPSRLEIVLASDLYRSTSDYWAGVVEVAKHTSLARMQRSITILGRSEGDSVDFAKLMYPAMQAADIFAQGVTLAHAGMDQRKAHVIARDTALHLKVQRLVDENGASVKPAAVHHPLLQGLRKPAVWPVPPGQEKNAMTSMKMSKSDAGSAIFIHDTPDQIRRKVAKAFCPPEPEYVAFNPVLDWSKQLVFGVMGRSFSLSSQDGSSTVFEHFSELEKAFREGKVHPGDLKNSLSTHLIDILEPVRKQYSEPDLAAATSELMELVALKKTSAKPG